VSFSAFILKRFPTQFTELVLLCLTLLPNLLKTGSKRDKPKKKGSIYGIMGCYEMPI